MPRKKMEETDITNAEALEILLKEQNPGPIESMMIEQLKEIVKLDAKSSRELVDELTKAGITNKDAVILANLLPENKYEVVSLLSGGSRPYISEEMAERVVAILKKYIGTISREDKK
jgi:DNA-directed RNA polymerase subunit F